MELTRRELFSAKHDKHRNVKEIDGETILPVAHITYQYTGADDKLHSVLVIKDGNTGEMFRSEVKAFIDKFMTYLEDFGDMPDEERPAIRISCRESKKHNMYANFDLVD